MLHQKKIIVILPAYNASKTLEQTYSEIPHDIVDDIVLTDDYSNDNTVEVAKRIGIKHIIEHNKNLGYGANQKSCYDKAIELGADVIIMLHPDYQYNPKLIPAMADLVANNVYDVILASRILGKSALSGGMPLYKYISNRVLTFIQNILMRQKLSEYHTGYRAFNTEVLISIPYQDNSNDFIFDNEILAQCCYREVIIGEISCPARYDKDSSSINFKRSVIYGLGVLKISFSYFLQKMKLYNFKLFRQLSK